MTPRTLIEPLEGRMMLTTVGLDGGQSFATATSLGKLANQVVVNNTLSAGESADYFRFSVRSLGNVNLTLTGLSANANLRLLDANGEQVRLSARGGTRGEWISRALGRGDYVVSVERASGVANTNYSLALQADLNWQTVPIDGQDYSIGLVRADGTSAPISTAKNTWVVIHGWLGNLSASNRLADAIDGASRRDQVLQLDWSSAAADLNVATVALRVADVGAYVASKLSAWGLAGSKINLVGHSLGGGMTDQIARRISGGVHTIVALDPATVSLGGIDFSGTDFAGHSQRSLAFIGSNYATASAAKTADTAVLLDVGPFDSLVTHDRVREIFTTMTVQNNSGRPDPITRMLSLSNIARGLPFARDAAGDGYEALLTGNTSPHTLSYFNAVTTRRVRIVNE